MAIFSRQKRVRRKKNRTTKSLVWQFVYGGVVMLIVVLLGYGVWYVTRLPTFTLSGVVVSGGETVSDDEVTNVVETELEGTYMLLIPKKFTYLFPKENILEKLNEISRVHNISLEKANRNTLAVSFEEYIPYALWCTDAQTDSSCEFLSASGYAFTKAPPLRGGAFVRHFVEGRVPETGVQLFEESDMERMEALMDGFELELDLRTLAITHTSAGDETYHLSGGGELFVSLQQSAQTTFDNLRSLLESPEYKHVGPGNFQYIDLRFGNRVFINEEVKDDTVLEVSTSTASTTETTDSELLEEG